jgi:hypothetical protein
LRPHRKKGAAIQGLVNVNAVFVVFLIGGTAILSMCLGVLGAYYAISGLLVALNPARPLHLLKALVPHQSQASGD